ncbi:MAG: 4-diphosphocytidyl-2-C-methyl-D-erythritol kinase [Verrucomicrobiota bacterium]|jgi:4-diphosphocytidyl-2-C-methyl-D-erythritol kinase
MTIEMQGMQVLAPAKINLSLRILGGRPDGFHEIETFIAPISLADQLTFTRAAEGKGIEFYCDDPTVPEGDDNLVVKAARGFFEVTQVKASLSIKLEKKIPHGAGLGGGSSDAAATLLALNQFFDTKLSRETLAQLGSKIGSDVPFFIFQSAAQCRGRGELVSPEPLPTPLSLLLLKPEFGVPTACAYGRWQQSREIPNVPYAIREFADRRFVNDLERPVFEKFVFLARLKAWLLEQSEVAVALMSGSGSTVFAILKSTGQGENLAERAKEELDPNLWTCVTQTL